MNDCSDVIASSGNTIFFDHGINQATKSQNPVKEGYVLMGILIPSQPMQKGITSTTLSRSKCIMKAATILLGYRFKTGRDMEVKFLSSMASTTFAQNITDVNMCAVPYSCRHSP